MQLRWLKVDRSARIIPRHACLVGKLNPQPGRSQSRKPRHYTTGRALEPKGWTSVVHTRRWELELGQIKSNPRTKDDDQHRPCGHPPRTLSCPHAFSGHPLGDGGSAWWHGFPLEAYENDRCACIHQGHCRTRVDLAGIHSVTVAVAGGMDSRLRGAGMTGARASTKDTVMPACI